MNEAEFRYKDTRADVDHEIVCNAGRRTPIGGDMCICQRLRKERDDARLIEILRGNLALHRRRARAWPDHDAAYAEAMSALKVAEQLKQLTGE